MPAAPQTAAGPADRTPPRVSVIVPNHNKATTLTACLRSVLTQTCPPAEIIVVDDASTDASRKIIAGFPCRLLALPVNRGVSAARNAGAAAASGDVLFFLDSDIALAPDALANALRILREHPACGVVQGIYDAEPLVDDGPVEVYKTLFEHHWRRRRAGVTDATLFALTAVPRRVFHEVGGFDEALRDAEDIEFGTRLPAAYEIRMSAEVVGRHDDVDRFWPFLTEHVTRAVGYGRLLAGTLVRRRPAVDPPAGRTPRGVDVPAVLAMACCAAAVLTLPLAALDAGLLAVPLLLVAGFVAVDRGLLADVRRRRGALFLVYFGGMHFLMHTTQLAGMTLGVVLGLARGPREADRPLAAASAPPVPATGPAGSSGSGR